MTTAYQHRPMSEILVADPEPAGTSVDAPPVIPTTTAPPEPQPLAEKYEGKTVAEIADMHSNAEQELGRVRNELGVQRGLVQDLSQLSRQAEPPVAPQEEVTITGDDLISDPTGSIQRVLQPQLDARDRKDATDRAEQQLGAEAKALETDFGDYGALVATDGFQKFALRTPSRQQDFQVAATGSGLDQMRAARRLLEDYTDFQNQSNPQPTPTPAVAGVADAAAASTEAGQSSAPISSKPQILESDVVALIHSDPLKYRSPSFQAELTSAIREGRFVKSS